MGACGLAAPPERLGSHAGDAAEDAAEIAAVREADFHRDLGDGPPAAFEQLFGLQDAVTLQVFNRGGGQLLPEAEGQVVFRDVDLLGNLAP